MVVQVHVLSDLRWKTCGQHSRRRRAVATLERRRRCERDRDALWAARWQRLGALLVCPTTPDRQTSAARSERVASGLRERSSLGRGPFERQRVHRFSGACLGGITRFARRC
jgi:hypothetical protein